MSSVASPSPESRRPQDGDLDTNELSDEAVGNLLDSLPDLGDEGDEGDEPSDLDPELGFIDAAPDVGEQAELDVGDASDLLLLPGEGRDDDDANGLEDGEQETFDSPSGEGSDDSEGLEEAEELTFDLPPLEGGDDADGLRETAELPELAALGDEHRPPLAKPFFLALPQGVELEACTALAARDQIVVAASTDLFWFGPKESSPLRLDAGSSRITSVVLLGTAWEYAVCSTTSGKLFRRGRLASSAEELRRVREAEAGGHVRDAFDLSQPGPAFPHTLLVRTPSGRLLRSDDDGASFRACSERRILALAPEGPPTLALSDGGTLLRSADGGGSFTEIELAADLHAFTKEGERVLLACSGDAVFLARADLGVYVSGDGGHSFRRVPGTQGVTAICAGGDASSPLGFAALHDETRSRSWLVRISAPSASAEIIAVIDVPSNDDEGADLSRTAQLAWDSSGSRLWAAGGFGVKVFGSQLV